MSAFAIASGADIQLGRGAIFFDKFSAAGAKQGSLFLGSCTRFEVTGSTETREKRGMVDTSNPLLSRVEVARTLEFGITMSEYKKDNLGLFLMGTVGDFIQAATPVVGESLTTSSVSGRTYFTAKRQISAYAVKVAAATKIEGTDYEIDPISGAVYIKPGGGIADASSVTIDYTPQAFTAGQLPQIALGNYAAVNGELRFVGNPMSGKIHEVVLWKCQMSPDGAIGLISEDFIDYPVKGTIVSDIANHATTPFGYWITR